MKKIVMALVAVMMIVMPALAESAENELVGLRGTVLEVLEEGYLIQTEEKGDVMVNVGNETNFEIDEEITCGDYVYVDYNGMMTRSLPPQVSAMTVKMHKLEGDVLERDMENNTILLESTSQGEVIVNLPDDWKDREITEEHITVYFDGATTMSLPPQVSAGQVIQGYFLQGTVTEINDEYILLKKQDTVYQVNRSGDEMPDGLEIGKAVRVFFNGQLTKSIPAQITATSVQTIGIEAEAMETAE